MGVDDLETRLVEAAQIPCGCRDEEPMSGAAFRSKSCQPESGNKAKQMQDMLKANRDTFDDFVFDTFSFVVHNHVSL